MVVTGGAGVRFRSGASPPGFEKGVIVKEDSGQDNDMSSLYQGSMGTDDQADTSKDTSGDDETIDQEDKEDMAKSSVVPMTALQGKDGEPLKRGDKVEVVIMDVFGGSDVKICRADAYGGDKENPSEDSAPDEEDDNAEIDRLSERM